MDPGFLIGSGIVIIGLVVWVVCAIKAYQLAPRRHRSAVAWGILAAIFGPFAFFALYLLPPAKA